MSKSETRLSRRSFLVLSAGALAASAQTTAANPPRPLRKDSFLGFHFDLHPDGKDTILGRDLTEEHIEKLLARTRPDYIQYDCKGHPGWLGYPSRVSPSSPGIVKDSLAMWRAVTARRGVGLYVHFSGVWDGLAVETYPEWARVDAEGRKDTRITSTFGPYVDRRLIPQLEEVSAKYDLDGVWVDGECWAVAPDYGEAVRQTFGEPLPKRPSDPRWFEFLELNRAQFRKYVRHYVDALHKSRPKLQIASNWLYTSYVPEKPDIPVDFVSGDYLGSASVATARVEARYLDAIDKSWDLMAWGFHNQKSEAGFIHKTPEQLMQEASVVLMQGGGFQVYYQPTRSGTFDNSLVETMGKVADFCHARKEFSHKTEPVPQVGVIFSGYSLYHTTNKLFGGWQTEITAPATGIVSALAESHCLVEVVPDWKLDSLGGRPMVVLPDWLDASMETLGRLVEYVLAGGRLLVTGAANVERLSGTLGLRMTHDSPDHTAWIAGAQMPGTIKGRWLSIATDQGEVIASRHQTSDTSADSEPAATLHKLGKGMVAAIPGAVGRNYHFTHSSAIRDFLMRVVRRLGESALTTTAPPTVEFALRRKGPSTILHMANMTNMQVSAEYMTTDFIPTVGPFEVRLQMASRPGKVTLEPGGKAVQGTWRDGIWTGRVESLHIHNALVFA